MEENNYQEKLYGKCDNCDTPLIYKKNSSPFFEIDMLIWEKICFKCKKTYHEILKMDTSIEHFNQIKNARNNGILFFICIDETMIKTNDEPDIYDDEPEEFSFEREADLYGDDYYNESDDYFGLNFNDWKNKKDEKK